MRFVFSIAIVFASLIGCNAITNEQQGGDIRYGKLTVPENRSNPDSREIKIHYAVIKANKNLNRPPIVFIQGGPGGSSLSTVPFFANSPLHEKHDIILFDARGTGKSRAYCSDAGPKFLDVMAEDLSVEEEYQAVLDICEACKEELKENQVDLAGYNSKENAADLEALRIALGIDKWILFGGSYGTRLGLTY
nr:alpha/beta hydrolase [Saprospiraceae bacterium]